MQTALPIHHLLNALPSPLYPLLLAVRHWLQKTLPVAAAVVQKLGDSLGVPALILLPCRPHALLASKRLPYW